MAPPWGAQGANAPFRPLRAAHKIKAPGFAGGYLLLGRLNAATNPKDMDLPGLKLHELSGRRKGVWSVWVSGNWRVTFRFEGMDAEAVDYEDYH